MGTWSFPGVKRPGRGVNHLPPSSAEVKEGVELQLVDCRYTDYATLPTFKRKLNNTQNTQS